MFWKWFCFLNKTKPWYCGKEEETTEKWDNRKSHFPWDFGSCMFNVDTWAPSPLWRGNGFVAQWAILHFTPYQLLPAHFNQVYCMSVLSWGKGMGIVVLYFSFFFKKKRTKNTNLPQKFAAPIGSKFYGKYIAHAIFIAPQKGVV